MHLNPSGPAPRHMLPTDVHLQHGPTPQLPPHPKCILQKPTQATTIDPSKWSHWHLSQRNANLRSHKNLHMTVHSSYIPDSPDQETTQMSFKGRMEKHTVIQAHRGILLSVKKEWTVEPTGTTLQRIMCGANTQSPHVNYGMIPFT